MVKSKARFFFKQYIMNKSVKWGFKLWTLACSVTGYTIDIQLAELNDTDRNLDGDIDLQGKSVAEVLCTLTRGAITRRHSASGRGEGGGLTVWHRRKQQGFHWVSFRNPVNSNSTCTLPFEEHYKCLLSEILL